MKMVAEEDEELGEGLSAVNEMRWATGCKKRVSH